MTSPAQSLPPGWTAEWNEEYQRYLFINSATGQTQWETPVQGPSAIETLAPSLSSPPIQSHSKRRQYAAGQSQSYYGAVAETAGYDAKYGDPQQPQQGSVPQETLFTPGLATDQGFGTQQQQTSYLQPAGSAPNDYGQSQQHQSLQPGQMGALTNQFSQMGVAAQITSSQLSTTNLLTSPPDPSELAKAPPKIRLPPNATATQSPHANAHHSYLRCTLNAVPTTNALLNKCKIPLALVITPYRSLEEGESTVPLVTDTIIERCRRCKTYMNPFVQFESGGNRWKCCMCGFSNQVPQLFDWDQERNQPGDRWARQEINNAVVEFVAPTEYMARAPQAAVYIILIDVSHAAIQSGMVATATRTILESLARIPNDDNRTKIGIICYDVSLYFFSMPPGTTEAAMLVVSDVDDVFLPKPTDLLVNLTEARASLESLLGRMHDMFLDNSIVGSALGPALKAGAKLMAPIGGQIIALSASLPSVGEGALKNREDPKILGTPKESGLLQTASPFYKTFAIECSRGEVSVDMLLFGSAYQDVASLACLPHYTAGQTYFYPGFNASRAEDSIKFAHEFSGLLAMPIMLEGIQRIRTSKGLRTSSFHGNFFLRSTDLLAMPVVPQDQSYTIEIEIEDNITTPFVVFQVAVLHTTCHGERRIRTITLALPTTSNLSEMYASADQIAIVTLLANKAVERSLTHSLENSREAITNKLVDIFTAYKASMTSAGAGASAQLALSENLRMLPVLVLGLLKNVGIRQSTQVPPDLRAYGQALLSSLPSQLLIPYLHANFYSLHNMAPEAGTVGDGGIIMPLSMPLSSEKLERHGLFLMEDGQNIFLWVGRDAVPQLIQDVFDLPSYALLRGGKITLPTLGNLFSQRVNAVIQKTREMRRGVYYPQLYVVKEDGEPPLRMWALSLLIQDRADMLPSYQQFLTHIKDKLNGSSY